MRSRLSIFVLLSLAFGMAGSQTLPKKWREAVSSTMNDDECNYNLKKLIEVQIDSEMLQKTNDHMSLLALASDLQQHRRLPGLPKDLSDLLDKKAKGIGKLAQTQTEAQMTQTLMNSLRR
ncbi:unnamed protein product [Symbiodinium necroappetens]|uniref:Uncharacterized protein n=1 Tax=Symbiodinium necroappetens TaxID=1628268 RepID=A0A813CQD4_9DINO|nr:unnamed protein product [Symbiodinium sp. CCMP2456]CAE7944627.1 unnamed protein product [Symbiodinium necroappetens]